MTSKSGIRLHPGSDWQKLTANWRALEAQAKPKPTWRFRESRG